MLESDSIIPRRTSGTPVTEHDASTMADFLLLLLNDVPLHRQSVAHVIDLYCGHGIMVAGELQHFPNAHVHAVDYQGDVLDDTLRANPRVSFYEGLVTNVLQSANLPRAEFVSISYPYDRHGFNRSNIELLRNVVGGFLLLAGDPLDNPLPFEAYFRDTFEMVKRKDFITSIWKPK